MNIVKSAFVTLLLYISVSTVESLKCYVCDPCPEPFNNSTVGFQSQPDGSGYSCRKIWTAVRVKRDMERNCVQGNVGGTGTWCCQQDYCNAGTSIFFNIFLLLVAGFVLIKYSFMH